MIEQNTSFRKRAAWEKEYRSVRGIHSTNARNEAACFPFFREVLQDDGFSFEGTLLDVGCGKGRNAVRFLREGMRVVGADISQRALEGFLNRTSPTEREKMLHLILCDMEMLPLSRKNFFNVIMNITTLENILDRESLVLYARRVIGLLRRGGYHLLYAFDREDGYYGPMLDPDSGLVRPAFDGIPTAIYTQGDVRTSFAGLSTIASRSYEFSGPMYGRQYSRRLVAFVMKKE